MKVRRRERRDRKTARIVREKRECRNQVEIHIRNVNTIWQNKSIRKRKESVDQQRKSKEKEV
jgi:hypothetical protein